MKSIGADHVIDYTKEDFTKTDQRYDMIYDLVGDHGFSERRQILKPNGICVLAGIGGAGAHPETMGRIVGNFWNAFRSNFSKEKFVFYIAKLTKGDFGVLRDLMQSGKVSPVIDRTYKLEQTADSSALHGRRPCARKSCRQDRLSDAYEMEKNPEVERARNPCHSLHLV